MSDRDLMFFVGLLLFIILAFAATYAMHADMKEDCRARGGRVVDVRGGNGFQWFCDEE